MVRASSTGDAAVVEKRRQQWCHALRTTPHGPELAGRIGRPESDLGDLAAVLGPVEWPAESPVPEWTRELAALVEAVESAALAQTVAEVDARDQEGGVGPLPFAHAMAPLVSAAQRRLQARVSRAAWDQLAPSAVADLADELRTRLTWLWAPTLEVEFAVHRSVARFRHGGLPAPSVLPGVAAERQLYLPFIGHLLAGGIAQVCREYPVLGRLTTRLITQWVDANAEFLLNLSADRARLTEALLPPTAGLVTSLGTQLSDRHDGGRTVKALTFCDGHRLIYKPRDLAIEAAFTALLHGLQARGLPLPLVLPRILTCGTHGWVEFVTPTPCRDATALARYYFRAGELLALLHVLGANDLHYENLIAHGEHPVPIDLETVMHPLLVVPAGTRVAGLNRDDLAAHTVLRVGLLPAARVVGDQLDFDISALGGVVDQDTPFQELVWEHVNTDLMARRTRRARIGAQANRPGPDGQPAAPGMMAEALEGGFRAMAQRLQTERASLLAADGPVAGVAAAPGRLVFRTTQFYAQMLQHLRKPEFLREGIDRSLALEPLAAGLTGPGSFGRGQLLPLVRQELRALEELDIPRFRHRGDRAYLMLEDGQAMTEICACPAAARAEQALRSLDGRRVDRECNLIRAAVYSRGPERADGMGMAPESTGRGGAASDPAFDPVAALALADRVGAGIADCALAHPEGGVSWLTCEAGRECYGIRPAGLGLYDGAAGIALFLAALAHHRGNTTARELALAALATPRRMITGWRASDPLPGETEAQGVGGLLYALVRCAEWLAQPTLLEVAVQAVAAITPARIAADRCFDAIHGTAGLIPGLLAVYRATGEPAALARAVDCGRHLIQHRQPAPTGGQAWPTLHGRMLTGFAHGAAGIAHQLFRLADAGGGDCFVAAAREAIAYEQSRFDPTAGNWPDLRADPNGPPAFGTSWCHGAPGIVLAHAAGRRDSASATDWPQLAASLEITLQSNPDGIDSLCCGAAGRIDILLQLAGWLERPDLLAGARRLAATDLLGKSAAGDWRYLWQLPRGVFHPTLFQGAAGIGYTLLRLALPGKLPSLLLQE